MTLAQFMERNTAATTPAVGFTSFCTKHGKEHVSFASLENLQQQTPQKPEMLDISRNPLPHNLCGMSMSPSDV